MTDMDHAIDDVARQMVASAPADDFTARTMARIGVQRRARIWWSLAPAGLVAGLAVAGGVAVSSLRVIELPALPTVRPSETTVATAPPVEPAGMEATVPASKRLVSDAERAWLARRLPALPGPPAIETDEIQPEALALPLLQLKPLVTEPIAIEPIDGAK